MSRPETDQLREKISAAAARHKMTVTWLRHRQFRIDLLSSEAVRSHIARIPIWQRDRWPLEKKC